MTPYTERRHAGYYNPDGQPSASTTSDDLEGLGAKSKKPAPAKSGATKTTTKKDQS